MDTCRKVLLDILDIVILLQTLFLCISEATFCVSKDETLGDNVVIFTFSVFQTYDQQIFYDQYRPANPHIYWAKGPSPISEHWSLFIIIYSIYEKDEIIFLKDPSEYNCWMAVKTRTCLAILWTMLPHSNELKYQKCSFWWRVAALWPALQTQLHYVDIYLSSRDTQRESQSLSCVGMKSPHPHLTIPVVLLFIALHNCTGSG